MNVPAMVRALSYLLTAVVVISFISFVWDEGGTASEKQVQIAADGSAVMPSARDAHGREMGLKHSALRLRIDEASDAITSPGESLGAALGGNPWALRGLAFLFGIFVFLIGLQVLANWLEKSTVSTANRQTSRDDRTDKDDFTPGYR